MLWDGCASRLVEGYGVVKGVKLLNDSFIITCTLHYSSVERLKVAFCLHL